MNIPHDDGIEQSLLACAITGIDGLDEALKLAPADFYKPIHVEVYNTIIFLADGGMPVNFVTVTNRLREIGTLDFVGGPDNITGWIQSKNGAHPSFYGGKIREHSTRRKLIELGSQIIAGACDEENSVETALDKANSGVQAICETDVQELTFDEGMDQGVELIEAGIKNGIPPTDIGTGLDELDYLTCGLHRQELTVLAARTSAGKTSLALQIAAHVAKRTGPVILFSLEMPQREIYKRLLSLESGVSLQKIRKWQLSDMDLDDIKRGRERLRGIPLTVVDTSDVSLRIVRARVRQSNPRPVLVTVDYLQIMRLAGQKNDTRTRILDEASLSLKNISRDYDCAVMALSQLSRTVNTHKDKRPQLDDLRDSGGIEQSADNVWFIHSAWYDEKPGRELPETVDAEIIVAKQRNGPRNVVAKVKWRPSAVRFEEEYSTGDAFAPQDEEELEYIRSRSAELPHVNSFFEGMQ